MKLDKLFFQFYGYLWYLIFFVLLLPALLVYMGSSIDYLVFKNWLGMGFAVSLMTAQILDLIAAILGVIGLAIIIEAALTLFKDGDTFPFSISLHKHARPSRLMQDGVYKHIRHPMLLGYLIALEGLGIWLRSPSAVLWLVPLWGAIILEYLVNTEEKNLRNWFGSEYQVYKEKTSLLIPRVL